MMNFGRSSLILIVFDTWKYINLLSIHQLDVQLSSRRVKSVLILLTIIWVIQTIPKRKNKHPSLLVQTFVNLIILTKVISIMYCYLVQRLSISFWSFHFSVSLFGCVWDSCAVVRLSKLFGRTVSQISFKASTSLFHSLGWVWSCCAAKLPLTSQNFTIMYIIDHTLQ